MKGGVPTKLKKLVVDSFRRHAWYMGVAHYTADILYMEENKSRGDTSHTLAEIDVNRRYLTCTLRIFPITVERWKSLGDYVVEDVIAHETAHIVTQHLRDCAGARYVEQPEVDDAWESLTESISRISLKLDKELKKSNRE